jgi:hypothetical protein
MFDRLRIALDETTEPSLLIEMYQDEHAQVRSAVANVATTSRMADGSAEA